MGTAQEQAQPSAMDAARGKGKGDQPAGPGAEDDVWDEERIEQALKVSKEMHIQVGCSPRPAIEQRALADSLISGFGSAKHNTATLRASHHRAAITYVISLLFGLPRSLWALGSRG